MEEPLIHIIVFSSNGSTALFDLVQMGLIENEVESIGNRNRNIMYNCIVSDSASLSIYFTLQSLFVLNFDKLQCMYYYRVLLSIHIYSKIPKRKNIPTAAATTTTAAAAVVPSTKLSNKMRILSSSTSSPSLTAIGQAVQASPAAQSNGVSKARPIAKRNNISNGADANSSKMMVIESQAKLFNHSQLHSPSNGFALAISEKNQQARRLLDFIQAQKANAKNLRVPLSGGGGVGAGVGVGVGDGSSNDAAAINGKIYSQPKKPSINGHQKEYNNNHNIGNGHGENGGGRKKSSSQIEMKQQQQQQRDAGGGGGGVNKISHPFVPSKRIIQHHDYQNLVDDTKTAKPFQSPAAAKASASASQSIGTSAAVGAMPMNRNRKYDNCTSTYDSVDGGGGMGPRVVDKNNNNNRKYSDDNEPRRTKTPIYRHFGDTNLLRNKERQSTPPSHYDNNNNHTSSNGNGISKPSPATYDKYQKVSKRTSAYADVKRTTANNNNNSSNNCQLMQQRIDSFPIISTTYGTSNLTNDTGFGSMDTDAASIAATPKAKSKTGHHYSNSNNNKNNFHVPSFQCINYNIKNRIKMFDVDPSPYRKLTANQMHTKR